jgi:hypothetical protein
LEVSVLRWADYEGIEVIDLLMKQWNNWNRNSEHKHIVGYIAQERAVGNEIIIF